MANAITLLRVVLSLNVLFIMQINPTLNVAAVILTIFLMLLDAMDGYLARYFKTASFKGSIFDILADRIIENVFFIFFSSLSLMNVWFAIIMVIRGLCIDAVRSIHAVAGKSAFGKNTFHKTKWEQMLVCSKVSRGSYNTLKMLTFVSFTILASPKYYLDAVINFSELQIVAMTCLWLTITLALIRAIPVFKTLKSD